MRLSVGCGKLTEALHRKRVSPPVVRVKENEPAIAGNRSGTVMNVAFAVFARALFFLRKGAVCLTK